MRDKFKGQTGHGESKIVEEEKPAGLNDKAAQEKRGIGTRLDSEAKCFVEFRADRNLSSFK
jgi:hypothetical protein